MIDKTNKTKEEIIAEEIKRFQQINNYHKLDEYTFIGNSDVINDDINEAPKDNAPEPPTPAGPNPPMPNDNPEGDNAPKNDNTAPLPADQSNNPAGDQAAAGDNPTPEGPDTGMPDLPNDNEPMDQNSDMPTVPEDEEDPNFQAAAEMSPMGAPTDTQQPGDEVIDVDDLIAKQDKGIEKMDKLEHMLNKLLDDLNGNKEKLDQSDEKIKDLQAELEKRVPTPIEKLSQRAKDGYPFNVSPDDFWNKKEAEGHYSRDDDNNGEDQQEYTITNGDIANDTNWKSISDSMNSDYSIDGLDKVFPV